MSGLLCNGCGLLNEQVAVVCAGCGARLLSRELSTSRVDEIIRGPVPSPAPPLVQQVPVPLRAPIAVPVPVIPVAQVIYRCPYCQSPYPPMVVEKVSGGGWVVFILLLLFCLPLCWLGLLIKDQYRVCATCRAVLG